VTTELVVVLDDDPTGAQAVADVDVFFAWTADDLKPRPGARAIHLLTNTRALGASDAYRVTAEAARAATAALPGADLVLRGDSTLRAHVA
jgi:uncharacterized protein YgbK (DUF1537 family)